MMVKVPERIGASPDSADTESLLTSLGTVMGTAPYMSLARTSPRSGRQRVAQGESASPGVCNTTRGKPAQRATARSAMWSRNNRVQSSLCRPLRGLAPSHRCIPRARGLARGYMLSPAARACGFAQTEEVAIVRTQGSRTRPGLHAVARRAGLRRRIVVSPGLADSPWATCCRPLRGLAALRKRNWSRSCVPRARGLALGYMLSPAARACSRHEARTKAPRIQRRQEPRDAKNPETPRTQRRQESRDAKNPETPRTAQTQVVEICAG